MRNVVTLSNLPTAMHEWLKQEAKRLSDETGEKISMYHVVMRAVDEYKQRVEQERDAQSTPPGSKLSEELRTGPDNGSSFFESPTSLDSTPQHPTQQTRA
jgi:hypothetical protein